MPEKRVSMLPSSVGSRRRRGLPDLGADYHAELDAAIAAALAAGAVIQDYYERAAAATYEKGDGSPVTDADLAADRAIRAILAERFPDSPILSEEGQDDSRRLCAPRCWIVDPLDGTEQFIHRTDEFDVLVALVEHGRPIVAVGYQPPTRTLVTATAGGGAWVRRDGGPAQQIRFEPAGDVLRMATSKWFGAPDNTALVRAIADRLSVTPRPVMVTGFSPRMFLPPRAIEAMIGVRLGEDQTMASEWDFAVADLVFHEAGGRVTDLAGNRFLYNKAVPRNVGGLIAAVDSATHAGVLAATGAVRREAAGA
jgi:3'-phosphoadenosine 5'-phosphosulfate (PAPS) 3'-phosphatase